MTKNNIYLGNTQLKENVTKVSGEFVIIDGEKFYMIRNYDRMPDFFMTIVSDSDHWMFISSNGSLSAGRKDRDNALFPYYTDDKINDYKDLTGSKTIAFIEKDDKNFLWEPFSNELNGVYKIERNIYKSIYGNKVIFEEVNTDLGVNFRYGWYNSEKFGFIKKSSLTAIGDKPVKLEILDGIRNILPNGVSYNFQNEYSNLLDAYKKNELVDGDSNLALYSLSSIPVDKAEPSESLFATSVWSVGLENRKVLISDKQLTGFRKGLVINTEKDIRANRGSYFVNACLVLEKDNKQEWYLIAEINQSASDIGNLNSFLKDDIKLAESISKDIIVGTNNLVKIVAKADGLQISNEELCSNRHFSNTLFNVMRGGVFLNNYMIDVEDFKKFVLQTNRRVSINLRNTLKSLDNNLTSKHLFEIVNETSNPDFIRIFNEYLPLSFSRRHGDPSRPWNQFSIENKNEDGSPKLDFQGNWRDIFQNWEALSHSYPGYIENIISKFVNASTPDGYNPYRIMRNGIDWELADPDDPWAYIGYWGDHQIIYLQKLLELSNNYHPGKLDELLSQDIFSYANVPYRIKPYHEIIANPQSTIDFDNLLNEEINENIDLLGADGRLILKDKARVYHVNLTEKILLTLLTKLSNFIPEAGIWLNTQRPEWNDANNALVGNGVSMVTLYYLRRYLKFWNDKYNSTTIKSVEISEELKEFFDTIFKLFAENTSILKKGFYDKERRFFTDLLGEAGSNYRYRVYENSFSTKKEVISSEQLADFTELGLKYIDQSIRVNRREDGLYHAYNLISFNDDTISIRNLYEMLEGQVAVLSSGYLNAEESLDVLDALKRSQLFRADQYSYLLYPDRELPLFIEKNNIPTQRVKESLLLSKLIDENDSSILSIDQGGNYHFNGSFRNADLLSKAINTLDVSTYGQFINKDKANVISIYEEMFDHQSFTGRSGTFYGYEGLGSIYWHMVSKLLLATEECFIKAIDDGVDPVIIGKIKDHYFEIKAGIGLYKSPEFYGGFPTDAYSHTPGNAGVKQPGMTGQVKEDLISRMGELGVRIIKGNIVFETDLLNHEELVNKPELFDFIDVNGINHQLQLEVGQLAFTICQTPVVYSLEQNEKIVVFFTNGEKKEIVGNALNKDLSELIFDREAQIRLLEVSIVKQ